MEKTVTEIKEMLNELITFWRNSEQEDIKEYYIDAYLCVLHNIEHIEKNN